MHQPLISIITVCRNASATIGPTLKSVDEQTFDDYEHIIVDGVSTDDTLAIVKSSVNHRRRVSSEPDRGIYDAMNRGIERARGRYLLFLNAGDRFHAPDTLSLYAVAIEQHPGADIIYGETDIVDADGKFIAPRHLSVPENLQIDSFAEGMTICHQAFMVSSRIASYYNIKYRYSSDYDWCIRCIQRSRLNVNLHAVVIDYLYEGETTRHRNRSLYERFKIMSYYYGAVKSMWRHLGFIKRRMKRSRLERKIAAKAPTASEPRHHKRKKS